MVKTGEMKGYTLADLEKARDKIFELREGGKPSPQQLQEARVQLSPTKKPKAPPSPEPIPWMKEIEKRMAAIGKPTEEESDVDFEWEGSGLAQNPVYDLINKLSFISIQTKPGTPR